MISSKEVLYILIREDDLNKIKNIKNNYFSLVPGLNQGGQINIKYPNPIQTYKYSREQLLRCEEIIKHINKTILDKVPKKENILIEELLKPFLDAKISIYLYLMNCIPDCDFYKLLVDGRWKIFYNKSSLITGIENEQIKQEGNVFSHLGKYKKIRYNFIHKLLARLQISLIKKLIRKKIIYVLSGNRFYFMPIIFKELHKRKKNILVYNQSQNIMRVLLIIFMQLKSLIFKQSHTNNEFFMIPGDLPDSKKIKIIYGRKRYRCNLINEHYYNYLLKDVENFINNNYCYEIYNKKLFQNRERKDLVGIFHTNRLPELHSLSKVLSKQYASLHLITHGTHTIQRKSKRISDSLEVGMLITKIPNARMYSQSIFSDDYLYRKDVTFTQIKPVKSFRINTKKTNSKTLNILSAGTVKQLGARRYYFESSFEYIYSTLELCKKLQKLDFDLKLTIRIRDIKNEINSQIIKRIVGNFKEFVEISKNKKFEDDLLNSDCLIALSSTTLEEAVNLQIPSMSYGLSSYNHFDYYKEKKYRINNKIKNFDKLKKIEDMLDRKFIYLEKNMLKRQKNIFDYIL